MPSQVIHRGATVVCAHSAPATPSTSSPRVTVSGQQVITVLDPYTIAGCPSKPPCAAGNWISGATRVTASGVPVAIFTGQSTTVPNGLPMQARVAQSRVLAT